MRFPKFDANLRQAFERETELFFDADPAREPAGDRPAERQLHLS